MSLQCHDKMLYLKKEMNKMKEKMIEYIEKEIIRLKSYVKKDMDYKVISMLSERIYANAGMIYNLGIINKNEYDELIGKRYDAELK